MADLRPYQQAAVNAAIEWMKKSIEPAVLELATGAGKSHLITALAKWMHEHAGKRTLCLAPSKELVEQNHAKYLAMGSKASIFSASAGSKCLRHPVVFGTPKTVLNYINRFGDQFALVIIDEAHGITPTIKTIIEKIKERNTRLRVIGMSATPYRMGTGFIYRYDEDGQPVPEDEASEPYFNSLLCRVTTQELIDMGYLTPVNADPKPPESYAAKGLELNRMGRFNAADVERVFEGQGRKTAAIVADIVQHSIGRMGVMIFAATVAHAKEIMQSLPPEISMMLGGDVNTNKKDREKLISAFKARRFKYLVSVGMLTTGFDAPHVDVIAIMRATESPGLLEQIIGRGLRLHDDKKDCLLLDYAENIERHQLQNCLFTPKIKAGSGKKSEKMDVECPSCGVTNAFSARPNPDRLGISRDGLFLDAAGNPIQTEYGPMPAHFGRRCFGQVMIAGISQRCAHRWTSKACHACEHDNDIAARYCEKCKAEIVDPNEKLRHEFIRVKRDPHALSTDDVLEWTAEKTTTQKGQEALVCHYRTKYRSFKIWYMPGSSSVQAQGDWAALNRAVFNGRIAPSIDMFLEYVHKGAPPKTVTYKKQKNSDFFRVYAYNAPVDEPPMTIQETLKAAVHNNVATRTQEQDTPTNKKGENNEIPRMATSLR